MYSALEIERCEEKGEQLEAAIPRSSWRRSSHIQSSPGPSTEHPEHQRQQRRLILASMAGFLILVLALALHDPQSTAVAPLSGDADVIVTERDVESNSDLQSTLLKIGEPDEIDDSKANDMDEDYPMAMDPNHFSDIYNDPNYDGPESQTNRDDFGYNGTPSPDAGTQNDPDEEVGDSPLMGETESNRIDGQIPSEDAFEYNVKGEEGATLKEESSSVEEEHSVTTSEDNVQDDQSGGN